MKTTKIKFMLTAICLLISIKASAYDFTVDGLYYDVVSLQNLTCEITKGDSRYSGNIVIPETVNYNNRTITVVGIGESAFKDCSGLTSVTIPNSVTEIGESAFSRCSGLTSITIPNSVTEIGESAFYGCSGLTSVTIPNSVTEIGGSAFNGCSGLTSITIPNSVTEIGDHAFMDCSGLTSITISNSVTEIRPFAFYRCSGLTSVTIPNSVTEIGGSAFNGCSGLTSITIPNSVTEIEYNAFMDCSGLTSITIPNSVIVIGKSAFNGCSRLAEVILENGKKGIIFNHERNENEYFDGCPLEKIYLGRNFEYDNSPFRGMKTLTSVTIGNTVKKIFESDFSGCNAIKELIIEDGTEQLEFNSPKGLRNSPIEYIYIGRNITSFRDYINTVAIKKAVVGKLVKDNINFSYAKNMTELYIENPTPPEFKYDSFTNAHYMNLNVYVPVGSLSAYQEADVWKDFWNLHEGKATNVGSVENVKGNNIRTENGCIVVEGASGSVKVYTTAGMLIKSAEAHGETIRLEVPQSGMYIVKAGAQTKKVSL